MKAPPDVMWRETEVWPPPCESLLKLLPAQVKQVLGTAQEDWFVCLTNQKQQLASDFKVPPPLVAELPLTVLHCPDEDGDAVRTMPCLSPQQVLSDPPTPLALCTETPYLPSKPLASPAPSPPEADLVSVTQPTGTNNLRRNSTLCPSGVPTEIQCSSPAVASPAHRTAARQWPYPASPILPLSQQTHSAPAAGQWSYPASPNLSLTQRSHSAPASRQWLYPASPILPLSQQTHCPLLNDDYLGTTASQELSLLEIGMPLEHRTSTVPSPSSCISDDKLSQQSTGCHYDVEPVTPATSLLEDSAYSARSHSSGLHTTRNRLLVPGSRSVRLARSLGAHFNTSSMSWTSSLATPQGTAANVAITEECSPEKSLNMGAARQLFSPGELQSSQEVEEYEAGLRLNCSLEEDTLEEAEEGYLTPKDVKTQKELSQCQQLFVAGRMPRIKGLKRLEYGEETEYGDDTDAAVGNEFPGHRGEGLGEDHNVENGGENPACREGNELLPGEGHEEDGFIPASVAATQDDEDRHIPDEKPVVLPTMEGGSAVMSSDSTYLLKGDHPSARHEKDTDLEFRVDKELVELSVAAGVTKGALDVLDIFVTPPSCVGLRKRLRPKHDLQMRQNSQERQLTCAENNGNGSAFAMPLNVPGITLCSDEVDKTSLFADSLKADEQEAHLSVKALTDKQEAGIEGQCHDEHQDINMKKSDVIHDVSKQEDHTLHCKTYSPGCLEYVEKLDSALTERNSKSTHEGAKKSVNKSALVYPQNALLQKSRQNEPKPKRLSLGKNKKRFFYPNKKQISETCPRKVFNFDSCHKDPPVNEIPLDCDTGQDLGAHKSNYLNPGGKYLSNPPMLTAAAGHLDQGRLPPEEGLIGVGHDESTTTLPDQGVMQHVNSLESRREPGLPAMMLTEGSSTSLDYVQMECEQEDDPYVLDKSKQKMDFPQPQISHGSNFMTGFTSGSGNFISVSDEAKIRALAIIMEEESNLDVNSNGNENCNSNVTCTQGLSKSLPKPKVMSKMKVTEERKYLLTGMVNEKVKSNMETNASFMVGNMNEHFANDLSGPPSPRCSDKLTSSQAREVHHILDVFMGTEEFSQCSGHKKSPCSTTSQPPQPVPVVPSSSNVCSGQMYQGKEQYCHQQPNSSYTSVTSPRGSTACKQSSPHDQNMWEDSFEYCEDEHQQTSIPLPFVGFKTGHGKSIEVKEGALERAKNLMNDDNSKDPESGCARKNCDFKNDTYTETVLEGNAFNGSKNVPDIQNPYSGTTKHSVIPMNFGGFMTGSGKNIDVSDVSLQTAKTLLHETLLHTDSFDEVQERCESDLSSSALGAAHLLLDGVQPGGRFGSLASEIAHQAGRSETTIQTEQSVTAAEFVTGTKEDKSVSMHFKEARELGILDPETKHCEKMTSSGVALNSAPSQIMKDKLEVGTSNTKQDVPGPSGDFQFGHLKKVSISYTALNPAESPVSEDETRLEGSNASNGGGHAAVAGPKLGHDTEVILSSNHVTDMERHQLEDKIENPCAKHDVSGPFIGFQTGLGKIISVSDTALNTAKKFVTEDEDVKSESASVKQKKTNSFSGFQTVHSKKVTVCDEALNDAKKLIMEEVNNENPNAKHDVISSFVGFQTGRGKRVIVSDAALNTAKKFVTEEVKSGTTSVMQRKPNTASGFHTGHGKKVAICDEALNDANRLIMEEVNNENPSAKQDVSRSFVGFQTGRGKILEVSEAAMNTAKRLVTEEANCGGQTQYGKKVTMCDEAFKDAKKEMEEENCENKSAEHDVLGPFIGFQTGRGKRVLVSDAALNTAKKLVTEDDIISVSMGVMQRKPTTASGFQIGHCKKVSDKAVNNAKRPIVEEENNENPSTKQDVSSPFVGFQTGRGKRVLVSDAALNTAKKLVAEEVKSSRTSVMQKKPNSFCGGQTQHGKKATIGDEAFNDAKKEMEEENCENERAEHDVLGPFIGFQTGRGKRVLVSDAALNTAKKFVTEDDIISGSMGVLQSKSNTASDFQIGHGRELTVHDDDLNDAKRSFMDDNPGSSPFVGFQTGRGKIVSVSDAALNTAKKLVTEEVKSGSTSVMQSKPNTLSGFQTGHGKKVTHEPVNDAKRLFMEEVNNENPSAKHYVSSPFVGFETGRGKRVVVSEAALNTAKKFVTEEVKSGSVMPREPTTASAFQTGHGKKVTAQDEALDNAKRLMKEEVNSENPSAGSGPFVGFQTGRGQRVTVTEAALKAAETLMCEGTKSDQHSDAALITTGHVVMERDHLSKDPVAQLGNLCMPANITRPQRPSSTKTAASDPTRPDGEAGSVSVTASMKTVDVAREASESLAALLSDGLDEMWLSEQVSTQDDRSMATPKNRGKRGWQYCPRKEYQSDACSLGTPVLSSPEVSSSDRDKTSGKLTFTLHSAPPADVRLLKHYHEKAQTSRVATSSAAPASAFSPPYRSTPSAAPAAQTLSRENRELGQHPSNPDNKLLGSQNGETCLGESASGACTTKADPEITKARLKARVAQAQQIQQKKATRGVRAEAGMLYQLRRDQAPMSLREHLQGQQPLTYTKQQLYQYGIHPSTIQVSAATAEDFRFNITSCLGASAAMLVQLTVGDGAQVIPDEENTVGKQEVCNALFALPSVDPSLISRAWVYNHYRWVVWKLAAMEVAFPHIFGARCLTLERVLVQLKYRYDREVDHSERSCLKKIHERDDTSVKPMVLCVCQVGQASEEEGIGAGDKQDKHPVGGGLVVLTDGWYSIPAHLDPPLTRMLTRGRIRVGTKLALCGAELMGPPDGMPPLEASSATCLKICANSVRRARWDARLGFCSIPLPPPLALSSLVPDGSLVSCVEVMVARVYPSQFMEKSAHGAATFRNDRAEQRAAQAYERTHQRHFERLCDKIRTDLEGEEQDASDSQEENGLRRRWGRDELLTLQSGAELYEAWKEASDQEHFQLQLSAAQCQRLQQYQEKHAAERWAAKQAEFNKRLAEAKQELQQRVVVPLVKLRLVGCHSNDIDQKISVLLTVWRPSDKLLSDLQEGMRVSIYNLMASQARGAHCGPVSLTWCRNSQYRPKAATGNLADLIYEPREVLPYRALLPCPAACLEVDLVGVVVHLEGSPAASHQSLQTVYLANQDEDVCVIKFKGGLAAHAAEDVVTMKAVLAICNLQPMASSSSSKPPWPSLAATELSLITTNPKQAYLRTALNSMKSAIKDMNHFVRDLQTMVVSQLTAGHAMRQQGLSTRDQLQQGVSAGLCRPLVECDSSAIAQKTSTPQTMDYSPNPARLNGVIESSPLGGNQSLQAQKVALLRQCGSPPRVQPLPGQLAKSVQRPFRAPRRSLDCVRGDRGTQNKAAGLLATTQQCGNQVSKEANAVLIATQELKSKNFSLSTTTAVDVCDSSLKENIGVVSHGVLSQSHASPVQSTMTMTGHDSSQNQCRAHDNDSQSLSGDDILRQVAAPPSCSHSGNNATNSQAPSSSGTRTTGKRKAVTNAVKPASKRSRHARTKNRDT